MASHFTPRSAREQEHSDAEPLFQLHLQMLYERRIRLARAALRAQLQVLQLDLHGLRRYNATRNRSDSCFSATRFAESIPQSHRSNKMNEDKFSASQVLTLRASNRSERIVRLATHSLLAHTDPYLIVSMARISEFLKTLRLRSNFTNPTESDNDFRRGNSLTCVGTRQRTAKVSAVSVVSSAKELTSDLTSEFSTQGNALSNCSNFLHHNNVLNDTSPVYYSSQYGTAGFFGTHTVSSFDASQEVHSSLEVKKMATSPQRPPRDLSRRKERPTRVSTRSRSDTSLPEERNNGFLKLRTDCSSLEGDRCFVVPYLHGDFGSAVYAVAEIGHGPVPINPNSNLKPFKPYFMNFGHTDVRLCFFGKHQGHLAYASTHRVSETQAKMTNFNLVPLTHDFRNNASERQSLKPLTSDRAGKIDSNRVEDYHDATNSNQITALTVQQLTPSVRSIPKTVTKIRYFDITQSPLSFAVPLSSNAGDEPVLEIDCEGRTISESIQ